MTQILKLPSHNESETTITKILHKEEKNSINAEKKIPCHHKLSLTILYINELNSFLKVIKSLRLCEL